MKNEKIKVAVYIRVGNKNQVDETKNLQKNQIFAHAQWLQNNKERHFFETFGF